MKRILLVNPPITDVGGPYPAVAYLAGFLRELGRHAAVADASLMVVRQLLSRTGMERVLPVLRTGPAPSPMAARFLEHADWYTRVIETAVRCLQGGDQGATALAGRQGYFPPLLDPVAHWARVALYNQRDHDTRLGGLTAGQRATLGASDPLQFAFGSVGDIDAARYRAGLFLTDVASVIRERLDPDFHLHAYASRLVRELPTFAPLQARLEGPPTPVDDVIDDVVDQLWRTHAPEVVGLSLPFAGTVYGALRVARRFRQHRPDVVIILGGGWINTTLRHLRDPGVFDYVDFITLDDGERPLQCLLEHLEGRRPVTALKRTFVRIQGEVQLSDGAVEPDVPFAAIGTPCYDGLPLDAYLDYPATLEPRARHWRGRWNKLTLAHGCYWKKCAFCDVSLDYIGRYEPATVDTLIARIRRLVDETGERGFHFVDEAMPPALLKRLAERLIEERIDIAWWGNVRFDAALESMAPLLARSGCVAVTGGVEAASDRLLSLMAKGVTLQQLARVTHALATSGIAVHAYLIYGFPTQTMQETVDALEYVRQLFNAGCLQSSRWHRFALTAHSPVAAAPERFGIRIVERAPAPFADYVLEYVEPGGIEHSQFGPALERAVARFAITGGDDRPAQEWFPFPVPPTLHPPDLVKTLLRAEDAP
jgi:hypothetical protein